MNRLPYPPDLTDDEWLVLEPYLRTSGLGRPPKHSKRAFINAIYYQARAGCAWRLLPHDFPPYRTVYKQFEAWREDGTWEHLHDGLRRQLRVASGRNPDPSAGAIDTQSGRTGGKRGAVTGTMRGRCGDDAGTMRGRCGDDAGRKRHVLVDTLGLPLAIQVPPASLQDPTGAPPVLAEAVAKAPTRRLLWGDGRYGGPTVNTAAAAAALGRRVEVVAKPSDQKGFAVLPHRWVVERTFGWRGKDRRVARRDFETNPRNSETWIRICMSNLMVRRLAKKQISKPPD